MPPWEIRSAIDLALQLWAIEGLRLPLACIAVGVLLSIVWAPRRQQRVTDKVSREDAKDVRRPTNTGILRRLWWKLRPPVDLMRVDGLEIDRTRKPHCLWLGPTGAGKSASVATVRLDGKRPTLCVMPDLSDPLRARADVIWTACEGPQPIDFLIGSPTEVAERLTEVFRSGGVGAWKRTARRATAQVIRQLDAENQPRSLQLIGERLRGAVAADRELRTVCAGWVERFLDLADQFGSSIGAGGLDLAELLNAGLTVVLDNDAFEHSSLGGDVVALGLAEAKRCANLVPGGFRLIFEEAGQLGERIDLADPFFRAGRRRKIAVDALTQAESDLNDAISANSATRVYFAQELKSLQRTAADRLGLDYRDLDPSVMRDFTAYVSHGKIRRLVHFPKPPKSSRPSHSTYPTPVQEERPTRRRIVIEPLPRYVPLDLPALPPPSALDAEVEARIDRSGHCHLWTGSKDKDGYGIFRVGKKQYRAHRYVWEQANGPLGNLDIDHQCRTRLCVRLDHLEPVTRRVNVQRMHRVRGHAAAD